MTFGYDGMGRRKTTTFANPVDLTDSNVAYAYDLMNRLTLAQDGNGHKAGYAYDALGRATTETGTWGSLASLYDAAGRRTRLTRGNGTVTSYGYDPVSRLASLTQDLGGSASDLTRSFTYNAAGQILSSSGNNAAYAYGYGNYTNGSVGYTANGLNGSVKRMWGRPSGDDNWLSRRPANLRRKTLHRTGRVADARKLSCAQARSYIVERPVRVGLTAQLARFNGRIGRVLMWTT